jgi:hypothetical protein
MPPEFYEWLDAARYAEANGLPPPTIPVYITNPTMAPESFELVLADPNVSMDGFAFVLPEGAVIPPRPAPKTPGFVRTHQRWFVPDRASIAVVTQKISPPMDAYPQLNTFSANGLDWTVYDISPPQNGSLIIAIAQFEDISIHVTSQGSGEDGETVPREFVEPVARSLKVEK